MVLLALAAVLVYVFYFKRLFVYYHSNKNVRVLFINLLIYRKPCKGSKKKENKNQTSEAYFVDMKEVMKTHDELKSKNTGIYDNDKLYETNPVNNIEKSYQFTDNDIYSHPIKLTDINNLKLNSNDDLNNQAKSVYTNQTALKEDQNENHIYSHFNPNKIEKSSQSIDNDIYSTTRVDKTKDQIKSVYTNQATLSETDQTEIYTENNIYSHLKRNPNL